MRISMLTPGTGYFYCGNCLRENTLAHALIKLDHDVTMIPLYLPFFTEGEPPPQTQRVFLGGINIYLQHKLPLFRKIPGFLTRVLDSPRLLRWSSKQGDMTDAKKHADLVLATLRGEEDGQMTEITRLLQWMRHNDRPDVVSLCNILLTGLARSIKDELKVPIVSTLHGEDAFLDTLPEPQRSEAWDILRERVKDIDAFIAVSEYYARQMQSRLDIDRDRIHVIHNGIDLEDMDDISPRTPGTAPPTIGYLARMCPDKGLHTLVDAFIELKRRATIDHLQLKIAGVELKVDRPFIRDLQSKLSKANCLDQVSFSPNISREAKLEFLQSLDVLSVPATYGESFGLYTIEALACWVPIVQPRHGAFPEIIERTGGGILCEPDDPQSLADELERLLSDHELAQTLSERGRKAVFDHFTAERMARDVMDVYHKITKPEHTEARPSMSPA